jgi:hypothetical protein
MVSIVLGILHRRVIERISFFAARRRGDYLRAPGHGRIPILAQSLDRANF